MGLKVDSMFSFDGSALWGIGLCVEVYRVPQLDISSFVPSVILNVPCFVFAKGEATMFAADGPKYLYHCPQRPIIRLISRSYLELSDMSSTGYISVSYNYCYQFH